MSADNSPSKPDSHNWSEEPLGGEHAPPLFVGDQRPEDDSTDSELVQIEKFFSLIQLSVHAGHCLRVHFVLVHALDHVQLVEAVVVYRRVGGDSVHLAAFLLQIGEKQVVVECCVRSKVPSASGASFGSS